MRAACLCVPPCVFLCVRCRRYVGGAGGVRGGHLATSMHASDPPFVTHAHAAVQVCVVARGDDPQTPRLAEAILSGCLPAIVIDGPLPFEDQYSYPN